MQNIAVIGAGAIGGITAAFLRKAGWDPEVVCKHKEIADLAINPGLHVTGVRGKGYHPVRAVEDIADISAGKDLVFIATKATDCVESATKLRPLLADDGLIVSLQNGICEDAIAAVVGPKRVVGCVVGWGASMHGPADLEMTSTGEFVIGTLDGTYEQRLSVIREMLSNVVPARISNNIMGELYSKLVINSCITTIGALTGMTLGNLLAQREVRNLFVKLMREAMAVADAMGIRVEPAAAGKLDYSKFLSDKGIMSRLKRHLMLRVVGFKYRRLKSSSLQSLERNRPTEIDYLNGYICEHGRANGVPTPLNDAVVSMIREIERGSRSISPKNLQDWRLADTAS